MKLKVGDRIIYNRGKGKCKGIIKRLCATGSGYYYVDRLDIEHFSTDEEFPAEQIFFEFELELDKQWYREKKINFLLK